MLPTPALPQARRVGKAIAVNFSRTDAGRALKAFGLTAGVEIVYVAGKDKAPVTLSVTVDTAESGVRSIATAAGLVYRKVGSQYVVAAADGMRQALAPYGVRAMLPVSGGSAPDMASAIQEFLPTPRCAPSATASPSSAPRKISFWPAKPSRPSRDRRRGRPPRPT